MEKIKAIFFDIDGTLVDMSTRLVPESTKRALNTLREKGIKLFICSGRHPSFRETLIKEVDFIFDGYIYVNGQCLTDGDGNIIYRELVDQKTRQDIYDYFNTNKHLSLTVMEEDRMFSRKGKDEFFYDHELDDLSNILKNEIYQIVVIGTKELDKEIEKNIKGIKNARWSNNFSDYIPIDGGKDKGVYRMLELFNIDIKNTMAFGDGGNDIPMLKAVNISVAMGNAQQEVKDIATYTTDDVDSDGIYNALKKYEVI